MTVKLLLSLFIVLWVGHTQFLPLEPTIPTLGDLSTGQDFLKVWYAYDCCPIMHMPSTIFSLKGRQGLLRNYRFFQQSQYCRCTHYVFGVDYSGSMNLPAGDGTLQQVAHDTLISLASYLDYLNNGSPYIYFFSYFYFNHEALIPEYLHIKPFTSLPDPIDSSGGTSFNNAIERGIQILQLFPGENVCLLLISDGGGYVNGPIATKLIEHYQDVENDGCYACSICLYIQVYEKDDQGLASFRDLCDQIYGSFYQATPQTYQRVTQTIARKHLDMRNIRSRK